MKQVLLITLSLWFAFANYSGATPKKDKKVEEEKEQASSAEKLVSGLKFRNVGPAWCSGRISDLAVNPDNHSEYYVAVASGHVWKTVNNGTTFRPIFDNQGAFSIGCVVMDPNNSNVVWVGTGENNHQRALSYGDGVYKSVDGGKSWKNMGLKESRQIGGIVVDPNNSNVVFVACEGSAWGPSEERGLYKSTDGGETWNKVLNISENTGVNNVIMDPSDSNIMYATSEQRRRTHFTKIGGGPESAVYKSTDNGETWRKVTSGLPSGDVGGMGIAVSSVDPNKVYIIAEAALDQSGFFRSTDKGESWSKMSSHASSGQYYNEITCDPVDADKVYSVETYTQVTADGGKTWSRVGGSNKHVDDHAIWVDPNDTKHFMIGSDGGLYETFDNAKTWIFKSNLPITQFYRLAVDNDYPFYNIYGGTQDNNSMCGPSQTFRSSGIINDDWSSILGGDGFWCAADPENSDIVYCEYQYGNMFRYDKKSGDRLSIKPFERKGEESYKWNWNTPLIISPHSKTRLYCAANKVFCSDDRGASWQVISDDLTSQTDRNTWPVMGKYWSAEAIAKDVSTSQFGTIISLDESQVTAGLLYVGTDDGVFSVTENNGGEWQQVKTFPGVPEFTPISDIMADKHDENVVYVSFSNLKRDDFKPYLLKSTDKGKTWENITEGLPENGSVHCLQQDHIKSDILFAGTEFSCWTSLDGGAKWTKLSSGLPTIAVYDMQIQERENDLVLATFGRGFYILDNYSPLRELTEEVAEKEAHIFAIEDALMYLKKGGHNNAGSNYYTAKNPDFGAIISYHVDVTVPKSKTQERRAKEKDLFKAGDPIPQPTWRELELEKKQEKSYLLFTIYDAKGNIVRKMTKSISKGLNRMTWDMRYGNLSPINTTSFNPMSVGRGSIKVMPGEYSVGLDVIIEGSKRSLVEPVSFTCKTLDNQTLPAEDYNKIIEFQEKVSELANTMRATQMMLSNLQSKVTNTRQALNGIDEDVSNLVSKSAALATELEEVNFKFNGLKAKASAEEIPPMQLSLNNRLSVVSGARWSSMSGLTQKEVDGYKVLVEEFAPVLDRLTVIATKEVPELQKSLDELGAEWTPGRIPVLK